MFTLLIRLLPVYRFIHRVGRQQSDEQRNFLIRQLLDRSTSGKQAYQHYFRQIKNKTYRKTLAVKPVVRSRKGSG